MPSAPPCFSLALAEEGHLQALIAGVGFEVLTGWRVAKDFCDCPGALEFSLGAVRRAAEGERRWWQPRMVVLTEELELAGLVGWKGPPEAGVVELGYSIAPAWRGRGLATAAVCGLCAEALAEAEIGVVAADTLPERVASVRVLEKAGFVRVGEGYDREAGITWRWEFRRR